MSGYLRGARIFSEGEYLRGTLTWGWQCFACRAEDTGFATATTAQESCDVHSEFCAAEGVTP